MTQLTCYSYLAASAFIDQPTINQASLAPSTAVWCVCATRCCVQVLKARAEIATKPPVGHFKGGPMYIIPFKCPEFRVRIHNISHPVWQFSEDEEIGNPFSLLRYMIVPCRVKTSKNESQLNSSMFEGRIYKPPMGKVRLADGWWFCPFCPRSRNYHDPFTHEIHEMLQKSLSFVSKGV